MLSLSLKGEALRFVYLGTYHPIRFEDEAGPGNKGCLGLGSRVGLVDPDQVTQAQCVCNELKWSYGVRF